MNGEIHIKAKALGPVRVRARLTRCKRLAHLSLLFAELPGCILYYIAATQMAVRVQGEKHSATATKILFALRT